MKTCNGFIGTVGNQVYRITIPVETSPSELHSILARPLSSSMWNLSLMWHWYWEFLLVVLLISLIISYWSRLFCSCCLPVLLTIQPLKIPIAGKNNYNVHLTLNWFSILLLCSCPFLLISRYFPILKYPCCYCKNECFVTLGAKCNDSVHLSSPFFELQSNSQIFWNSANDDFSPSRNFFYRKSTIG